MTTSATDSAPRRRRASDDDSAHLSSQSAALTQAPSLSQPRSRFALCIGIDGYPAAPLQAAGADADRWAQALVAHGFDVRVLKDRKATRARVEAAISNLLEATDDGGQAIIQFAGHATQVPDPATTDALLEALVPFDYLGAGCITHADLALLLLPHANRLDITLFLDCSHPGSIACVAHERAQADAERTAARADEVVELRCRYLPLPIDHGTPQPDCQAPAKIARSEFAPALPALASRWVQVAAAREGEFAYETAAGGEFSLAALRHLPRAIKERWLPARFLDAVRSAMPAAPAQTPQLQPIAGPRGGQALLGNPLHEPPANAVASVNSLSLRELIRAVDALSAELPVPESRRR